eukprot:XP_025014080.1 receptor-like serine/threonine-protein kinase SD1-8 isoform X1 [Ricinus communis]
MSKMRDTGLEFPVKLYMLCGLSFCLSHALETLRPIEKLYNNETLVSAGEVFELGFFASSEMSNHYLGIWFKKDKTKKAVWVANRDNPLIDSSGFLKIWSDGNMMMSDSRMQPIMVNIGFSATSSNTSATLLDSGNLILMQGEKIVWQSFDSPTDTFLPGMKLGWFDMDTDQPRRRFLLSWFSPYVPASGSFAVGLNAANKSDFSLFHHRTRIKEIGFWDGHNFRFIFESSSDKYNFSFVSNDKEVYLNFDNKGNTTSSWFVLSSTGEINEYTMTKQGIAMVNHSLCDGVSAFNSNDCLIELPLDCKHGNMFSEIKGLMPISMNRTSSSRWSLGDCEIMCRSNCSCTAFASLEDAGIRCELYYGDREDLVSVIGKGNNIIYIRGRASSDSGNQQTRKLWWVIAVPVISVIMIVLISLYFVRRTKRNRIEANRSPGTIKDTAGLLTFRSTSDTPSTEDGRTDVELLLIGFSCIARATNNFSDANKIGEGGFGPVYMGKLSGKEIAVKRLSTSSGQGIEEFKTEVQLISKLQHVNLVRLLGCCIEQEEKILIYEYMPNKSLDSFIFDPVKRRFLDWMQRKHIIEGIAQGLLYLHKYSRLRIVHRDLKTSNILLDSHMNPKISDFGMARIFSDNESRTKTKRVVGTYGYMSPEYGVHGLFSTKSDVYSFGVILIEIVSGRKNTSFYEFDNSSTLVGHAWELWNAGRCIELMDPVLADSFSVDELMQCIQVGLLCIQDNAEDRPTMADIVTILSNGGAVLPNPKKPIFSTQLRVDCPSSRHTPSLNLSTFSDIEAR